MKMLVLVLSLSFIFNMPVFSQDTASEGPEEESNQAIRPADEIMAAPEEEPNGSTVGNGAPMTTPTQKTAN